MVKFSPKEKIQAFGSHELAPYHAAKGAVTLITKKDVVTRLGN